MHTMTVCLVTDVTMHTMTDVCLVTDVCIQ